MTTKISAWGNSLGVRIPKIFLDSIFLESGSPIRIELKGKAIVITPEDESLADMMARVTPENKHEEYWNDRPVGREVW